MQSGIPLCSWWSQLTQQVVGSRHCRIEQEGPSALQIVQLGQMVENGATSLPKIFIGGKPLAGAAGYSALAASIESGELEGLLKKAGAKKL